MGELKIDQAFVASMAKNADDAVIVKSTIELGHNMGLKVVAEGRESWMLLQQLGCDDAQGYYVSKPLAPDLLERRLPAGGMNRAPIADCAVRCD